MQNVLLVVHILLTVAMILLILLQRTAQDGGGLMGGGGTMGGMFTARGGANVLSRSTAVLAALFIATSLLLTVLAHHNRAEPAGMIDKIAPIAAPAAPSRDAPKSPAEGDAGQHPKTVPDNAETPANSKAQPPASPLSVPLAQ